MKRGWIGAAILLALLIGGGLSAWDMFSRQQPLEEAMDAAARQVLNQDWDTAANLVHWTKQQWQQHWKRTASFSDHRPMEEIDALFSQLEIYGAAKDSISYALVCAQLARAFSAMGEDHIPSWWNLL